MKKINVLTSVAVIALSLVTTMTGCSSNFAHSSADIGETGVGDTGKNASDSLKTYSMTIAHAVAEVHPSHQTLLKFKENVETATNGILTVDIIPNGALGGEAQMAEMVSNKQLEAAPVSADAVTVVKELSSVGTPYLFKDRNTAFAALDGEYGDELARLAEEKNILILGWGDAGFRNVTNNKEIITNPDQMKGIKIRTMETQLHMKYFKDLGANPTPVPFNELYTALEQGTVDAEENPITAFTTSKLYEVQKYMSLTEHIYTAVPLCVNKEWFESLPEEIQVAIKEAAETWEDEQRQAMIDAEESYKQECSENGVTITELTEEEKQVWIDKAVDTIEQAKKNFGEDLISLALSFN